MQMKTWRKQGDTNVYSCTRNGRPCVGAPPVFHYWWSVCIVIKWKHPSVDMPPLCIVLVPIVSACWAGSRSPRTSNNRGTFPGSFLFIFISRHPAIFGPRGARTTREPAQQALPLYRTTDSASKLLTHRQTGPILLPRPLIWEVIICHDTRRASQENRPSGLCCCHTKRRMVLNNCPSHIF